ncbi:MAG: hypothetical protein Q4F06_04115 [Eubacteriales bacterium]|nr:hypothetical protein [Eubacteriales bacterium]
MEKKGKGVFWKVYGIVVTISVIVIVGVWILLWSFLSAYEKSQPEYVADNVIKEFNNKTTDVVTGYLKNEAVSELQDKASYEEFMSEFLSEYLEGEWTYTKKPGEYSKENPVYKLKKDGKAMAVLYLKKDEQRAAFNTPKWNVDRIEGIDVKARTITIEVPKGSEVTFNNTVLTSQFISEDDIENSRLENVKEFVTAPKMTVYTVEGIYTDPEISVKGPVYGKTVSVDEVEGDRYVYGFESGNTDVTDQESMIKTISEIYGKYVSNDARFSALSPYILKDSHAYDILRGVSNTNIWFAEHTSTGFEDMKVFNYQVYTEDCFSCEVTFNQYIIRESSKHTYPTRVKYVFIKKNSKWYVADISVKSA